MPTCHCFWTIPILSGECVHVSEVLRLFLKDQHEQWPKPWLIAVYRGWNTTQLYRDYFISHEIRNLINQSGFHGMSTGFCSRGSHGLPIWFQKAHRVHPHPQEKWNKYRWVVFSSLDLCRSRSRSPRWKIEDSRKQTFKIDYLCFSFVYI